MNSIAIYINNTLAAVVAATQQNIAVKAAQELSHREEIASVRLIRSNATPTHNFKSSLHMRSTILR